MQGDRHALTRALCAVALLLATAAPAQTIYRCGNSYSQTPCAGGTTVPVDEARDRAQEKARKAQADAATQRDLRTAAALEKSRLKEEEATARASRPGRMVGSGDATADDYDEARAVSRRKPPYFTARTAEPARKNAKATSAAEKKNDKSAAPARP